MAAALLDASLILLAGVVTVIDLRSRLVPDLALLGSLVIAVPVCALSEPGGLPERMLAAVGALGFLLIPALLRPEGMGRGDVKLAGVLGFYLGARVIESLAIAFAIGSLAGLVLIFRHGWAARRRTIPFAPCLALGALATIAAQP